MILYSTRSRDRAYDLILQDVLDARLQPGERLVEAQLAARFGISRTPVREALFRLEQEGFVETELRRGFSVRPCSEREARETYPIVSALESLGLSESGALLRATVSTLRNANRALLRARKNALRSIEADRAFHRLLIERSANALLIRLIENLHRVIFRYEVVYMSDAELIEISVEQHEAIIDAIERGDLDAAGQALRHNYDAGMQAVIRKIVSQPPRMRP